MRLGQCNISLSAISLALLSGLLGTLLGMLLMIQSFACAFQSGKNNLLVVQVALAAVPVGSTRKALVPTAASVSAA